MSSGHGEREGPSQDIPWVIRLPLHHMRDRTRQIGEVLNLLLFPTPICSSMPRPRVFQAALPPSAG